MWDHQHEHQQDVRACVRCSTETDAARTWILEGEKFVLCGSCNPKLYRLIRDWLKLGWTEIPAKENLVNEETS